MSQNVKGQVRTISCLQHTGVPLSNSVPYSVAYTVTWLLRFIFAFVEHLKATNSSKVLDHIVILQIVF